MKYGKGVMARIQIPKPTNQCFQNQPHHTVPFAHAPRFVSKEPACILCSAIPPHVLSPKSLHPLLGCSSLSSGIPVSCWLGFQCFLSAGAVSGRSELPPLLPPPLSDPSLPLGTRGTARRPPRHVATFLRYPPSRSGSRVGWGCPWGEPITLSHREFNTPRHSPARPVPSGGACPGAAAGPVLTTPFCSLGRGSGALKPARDVQGHGGEGGPAAHARLPEPLLPCPRSEGGSSASSRSSRSGRAPSIGGERWPRAGLGSPQASGGSPFSLTAAAAVPAAQDRLGKSLQEPPTRWALQRFNSVPARLITQPASARQDRAVAAARRHGGCLVLPIARRPHTP